MAESPQNPLYPGYYPGEPIQRPPKFTPTPPNEYNFNYVQDFIKQLDFDIGNVPNWVKEQAVSDMKRALTVAVGPRDRFSYDTQRAIETGELDEAPGVQLKLSLNPQDWLEDPGKQLNRTLNDWKNSIINNQDWESYVDRQQLWIPLIRGEDPKTSVGAVNELAKDVYQPFQLQGAFDDVTKSEYRKFEVISDPTRPGEYTATEAIPPLGEGRAPLYSIAGTDFVDFTTRASSMTGRKGAYTKFLYSTIEAVHTDAETAIQEAEKAGVNFFDVRDKRAYFEAKKDIALSMKSFKGTPMVPVSMAAIPSHLAKIAMEGEGRNVGGVLKGAIRPDPTGTVPGIEINLAEVIDLISDGSGNGHVDKALQNLQNAKQKVTMNDELLGKLNRDTANYEKYLLDVQEIAHGAKRRYQEVQGNQTAVRALANDLKGKLDVKKNQFSPDLASGIEDTFLYNFVHKEIFNDSEGNDINELFSKLPNDKDSLKGYRNMERVLKTSQRMYNINEAQDFARAVNDGKLMQYFGWQVVRTRLGILSPGELVEEGMKRTHYFGLKYDDDMHDRIVRLYGVDPFASFSPQHNFSINVGGNVQRFKGGADFIGADKLHGMMLKKDFGEFVTDQGHVINDYRNIAPMSGVIKVLNEDFTGQHLSSGSKQLILGDIKKIRRFKNEVLLKRFPHLFDAQGKLIDTEANRKLLLEVMAELGRIESNKDLISTMAPRAGILQHLSSWANLSQTRIVQAVKKYVGPIYILRRTLIEALSKAVDKIVTGMVAGITAGVGIAAAPIVGKLAEYLTKYIVGTITNFAEKLAGSLIKMDFGDVIKDIEKAGRAMTKIMLYGCGTPIILLVIVAYIFSVIIGGSSNFNPARTGGGLVTGDTLLGGAVDEPPPPHDPARCPLPIEGNPRISTPSLNGNSGHGSRSYWFYVGDACNFTIPYLALPSNGGCPNSGSAACGPSTGAGNLDTFNPCYVNNVAPLQSYYGYAIDVVGSDHNVFFPQLGTVETWTVGRRVSIYGGAWGHGVIITGTDATDEPLTGERYTYKLYLGHLDNFWVNTGDTGAPGDPIARLYSGPGFGSHIHIEVTRNDIPLKPESLGICTP